MEGEGEKSHLPKGGWGGGVGIEEIKKTGAEIWSLALVLVLKQLTKELGWGAFLGLE